MNSKHISGDDFIVRLNNVSKISRLYDGWNDSMLKSCFQGVMGEAYADSEDCPRSAVVYVNCFAFAAGEPSETLISEWYNEKVESFAIITSCDDRWNSIFEAVGKDKCKKVERYAIKKENNCFNVNRLKAFVNSLDPSFELKLIDEEIYNECKKQDWTEDFVTGYSTYNDYKRYGIGVVAFKGTEMVSGASSYSSYKEGIEIEIDTKKEYRRQGLATACGAKLIIECLKRGLYPSWDAQNKMSVSLAEKLGYHYDYTYTAYEMWK